MGFLILFHMFFVFIWIGSMFTASSIMGYAAEEVTAVHQAMHRITKRVYFLFIFPSMIVAVCLGILLLFIMPIDWSAPWLYTKLGFAVLLILCNLFLGSLLCAVDQRPSDSLALSYRITQGLTALSILIILFGFYVPVQF